MTGARTLLVLDGLFDDLALETAVAGAKGWGVARWDGSDAALQTAVAVVHVRTRVDRQMLDRMPACRVVGRFGTGLDTVDQAAAAERGIGVVGVRDYCVPELATQTLALAFALDRRINALREERLDPDVSWQEIAVRVPLPGRTTATVIGLGSVGTAVTRALIAVGIGVRVVTRHGAAIAAELGAEPVALDEGLAGAGFVFLHTSLGPETTRMIDGARLARMAPGAILINTARIGLLDEAAVADALSSRRLGGLGLDAKLAPDSPLRRLLDHPRFLLTPHTGWYSARSAQELRERTVSATIDKFLELDRSPAPTGGSKGGRQ